MTRRNTAALGVFIWIAATASLLAQDQSVFWVLLKDKCQVQGRRMQLGDLAEIGSLDKKLAEELRLFDVGASPLPGKSLLISRSTLRKIILKGSQGKKQQFAIRGASAVSIRPRTIDLSGGELLVLARRHLAHTLKGKSGIHIMPRTAPEGLSVPAGRYSTQIQVRKPRGRLPFAGLTKMRVVAVIDGKEYAERQVELTVVRRTKVLVAKKLINRGKAVTESEVEFVSREIRNDVGELLLDPSQVQGLLSKRRIQRGEILRLQDFRGPPVIFRNSPVVIELISGALKIRSEGTALGEGSVGEVIAVRTGKRRRVIRCEVVDSRTVRIVMNRGPRAR